MNKFIIKVTSVAASVSVLAGAAPAVYAQDDGYATREYVVSEFVQSVGRNTLSGSGYILSTFADADEVSNEYASDFEKAVSSGLIRGYEDKTLRPKENITRIEALSMLARCIPEADDPEAEAVEFTDVPEWAKNDIDNLSALGLVKGYGDGTLGAYDNITVEQVKLLTDRSDELLNTVSPADSFYGYVNNKTFRNYELGSKVLIDSLHGVIVPNENSWSYLSDISKSVVSNEKEILTKLVNGELEYEKGTPEQRIYDMLDCIDRQDEKDESDIELYNKYRSMIADAEDIDAFFKAVNDIYVETGINAVFTIQAGLEPTEHKVYPQVQASSPGLGGMLTFSKDAKKTYELKYHELLKKYLDYSGAEFSDKDIEAACGIQEKEAKGNNYLLDYAMGKILRMSYDPEYSEEDMNSDMDKLAEEHPELIDPETELMKDTSEMIKIYTFDEADKMFANVNVSRMLTNAGFNNFERIIMPDTGCIEACSDIFTNENLKALKANALLALGESLQLHTSDEEAEAFDDLQTLRFAALMGMSYSRVKKYFDEQDAEEAAAEKELEGSYIKPRTERLLEESTLNQLGALLPNDVGLLYCKYYYSDETSDVVADMIGDIWDAYENRIKNNEWMSEETKANAIKKLDNMIAIIGYPDNYNFPEILSAEEGGTFFKNALNISKNELNTCIRYCGEDEFIRTIMIMTPDTVNACYVPALNIMNIPAGILNWPVYDPDASYAANLGAIGAVIAHEIGHAFDAEGARYDENGCLNDWWTEEDAKIFEEKKQEFVDYYERFEVMDGVVQDSELTITENMADIAGIHCVFDIIGDDKEAQKEALESFARMWACMGSASIITSDYYMQNEHSANQVRVNACVTTLDCFYDIYDVKEGDPMYVAPEARLKLW